MKNKKFEISQYLNRVIDAINHLDRESISKFIDVVLETYNRNGTIFIFGNGGSGATASHFAGDFIKGVSFGLDKRFKVICLNDNIPGLAAIANDISYDDIFIEQLKNFVKEGDLVIGVSGSGNSVNIIKAIEYAKKINAKTVALCGFDGGKIKEISDLAVCANINDMEISEDIHMIATHCIKQVIMDLLSKK